MEVLFPLSQPVIIVERLGEGQAKRREVDGQSLMEDGKVHVRWKKCAKRRVVELARAQTSRLKKDG